MAERVLSEEDKASLADWLHMIDKMKGAEAQKSVERFNAALHHCMNTIAQRKQAHAA